jgi:gluconolactonase
MFSTMELLLVNGLFLSPLVAQQQTLPQSAPAKDMTVAAIPGVIEAGAKWTLVWQGPGSADGIVGTDDGGLLFAQEKTYHIYKLDKEDKVSVYLTDPHGPGAAAIGPNGQVIAAERACTLQDVPPPATCPDPPAISALTPRRKVLADSFVGKLLGRINDLVADSKGGVYFTTGAAFYVSPTGKVSTVGLDLTTNGIMLSPDEKTLYITNGPVIAAFDVQPDGSVKNQREFGKLEGGGNGDGMAIDAAGRLYVSTRSGVQVLGPDGRYLGLIPAQRSVTSSAFSGPDKKTLYVSCAGALGPDGQEIRTTPGVRNLAMTVYRIPMLAQGFKGRPK